MVVACADPHAEAVFGALAGWPDPPPPPTNEYGHVSQADRLAYERAHTLNAVRRRPGQTTNELSRRFYAGGALHWWLARGQVRKVKREGLKCVRWWPVWPPEMPLTWEGDNA